MNGLIQKAKPILFNTEMVRAIQDGRKTETRRPIKGRFDVCKTKEGEVVDIQRVDENDMWVSSVKPPYQPGDILYVRETWGIAWEPEKIYYKADQTPADMLCAKDFDFKWRPNIHMPKEAARIFLRVTDVRVERVQDITEEGAMAEGIREYTKDGTVLKYWIDDLSLGWGDMPRSAVKAFEIMWNSLYAKRGYGWDLNPWVFVIKFERIDSGELAG